MKRASLALVLSLAACGSPRDAAVATSPLDAAPAPAPPPLPASAPNDAGVSPTRTAATSEYKELLDAIHRIEESREQDDLVKRKTFAELRALADPRAADDLASYVAASGIPRWRTQAAFALAELGDVRAADALAWRMQQDPLKLYTDRHDIDLRSDDHERIEAARLLSDLVVIHPEEKETIRKKAEGAVLSWLAGKPQPHANGMRFLALVSSPVGIAKLRAWADPPGALPKEGEAAFPASFAVAQSALRWLGRAQRGTKRDEAIWALLVKQLGRRPAAIDTSMNALLQGGGVVRGMALRALAFGAANGFAEWGDEKAFPLLVTYAEEPKNNDQARFEACASLASVASAKDLAIVADKIKAAGSDPAKEVLQACFLEAFARRPFASLDLRNGLFAMANMTGVGAFGLGGTSPESATFLVTKLDDARTREGAALVLLLGGSSEQAAHVLAEIDAAPSAEREELQAHYVARLGVVTDHLYENGSLARWVRNAAPREWSSTIVAKALQDLAFDNGPHTLTHVQLRARLLADARDASKRADAILVLQAMGERGALASLDAPLTP